MQLTLCWKMSHSLPPKHNIVRTHCDRSHKSGWVYNQVLSVLHTIWRSKQVNTTFTMISNEKTRLENAPAVNKECSTLIIGTQESKWNNSQSGIEKVRLNGWMINTLGGILYFILFCKIHTLSTICIDRWRLIVTIILSQKMVPRTY